MSADFLRDFNTLLDRSMAYLKESRNVASLSLGSKIILDTPKDTGALRGSWRSTLGAPSEDASERIDAGDTGDVPREELAAAIKNWPETGTLYMTNRQKYSEGVEFDSWSVQQPAGMVRRNIAGRTDFADFTTGTGRTE
jgi:hypothetical protein